MTSAAARPRANGNSSSAKAVQNRVVVEPEPLADGETREPLFIELGCFRELCLRHPTGGVHAVLDEDGYNRSARKPEVSSNRANVANSLVMVNELLHFSGSELTGALRSKATFHGAF
jgi:hypothetical protein